MYRTVLLAPSAGVLYLTTNTKFARATFHNLTVKNLPNKDTTVRWRTDKIYPKRYSMLSNTKKVDNSVLREKLVQAPQKLVISHQTKNLIQKLLLGRLSVPEIAKVTGVSEEWLQRYINGE